MRYSLRKAVPNDLPFEEELYATTRDDLRMLDMDRGTIDLLIRQQFDAQRDFYTSTFSDAETSIIMVGRKAVGRLIVARREGELHGIDITLLPEYRSRGIGSAIIRDLFAEADREDRQMRIHVMETNRARHLYRRLGFVETGNSTMHHMEMIYRGEGTHAPPISG